MARMCPRCGSMAKHDVVDSRPVKEGPSIRRRCRCGDCHARFTTYEVTALQMRRIEEWDRQLTAIRQLAKLMLDRVEEIDQDMYQAARDRVLMLDMTPAEKRRGDGPPIATGMPGAG